MERLLLGQNVFTYYEYINESEFEAKILEEYIRIFGQDTIYIDIKKKIGSEIITIPDGYLIDFTFKDKPRLYIIENELSSHDPYKHIGSQLLKFAISYKESGRKIKKFLLDNIIKDSDKLKFTEKGAKGAGFRNIDELFDYIIFEAPVAAIVVIDHASNELINVLNQLTIHTDIIRFQTFIFNNQQIHKFTPFNEEIREIKEQKHSSLKVDDLDTIVVPARKEGFEEVFLGENRWYSIRISASMLDKIKYIAGYQTYPVSAITHYAEVSKIEKWEDSDKYVVYFKEKATKIESINLELGRKGVAPQAPRYTSFDRLMKAKNLDDVFN